MHRGLRGTHGQEDRNASIFHTLLERVTSLRAESLDGIHHQRVLVGPERSSLSHNTLHSPS